MSSECPQRNLSLGVDSGMCWQREACTTLPVEFKLIWKKSLTIHLFQEREESGSVS